MDRKPPRVIRVFVPKATDEVLADHRRIIEESNLRVIGEPTVTRVANDGYVEAPGAPAEVDMVVFQVEVKR